ncbi:MAG: hypothetical protein MUF58_06895 [Arcicella sp.]|jgi:hypothetical protein|nr:hypothetical protein [Arcicella sp.]
MKAITFFILSVCLLGCQSESQKAVLKETLIEIPKQLSNSKSEQPHKSFGRVWFEKIINRIEYEMVNALLSNAIEIAKAKSKTLKDAAAVLRATHLENDLDYFHEKIPLQDSDSWEGKKVKDAFYEIAKEEDGTVKYKTTESYIQALEVLKDSVPIYIMQNKDSVLKYFTKSALLYQVGFLPFPNIRYQPPAPALVQSIFSDVNKSKAYEKILTTFVNQVYSITQSTINDDSTVTVSKPSVGMRESRYNTNDGHILILLLFFLIIAFGSTYFYYDESKRLMNENKELKYRLSDLLDENMSLRKQQKVMEESIQTPTLKNEPKIKEPENTIVLDSILYTVSNSIPNPDDISSIKGFRYAGRPNEDGSFTELEYSFVESKHFYCFDVYQKKATFWIEKKPKVMAYLLQYPDMLISPVCHAVNAFLPTGIITEEFGNGQVQWDDGKQVWRVTQKAKIRYLSEAELEALDLKEQQEQAEQIRTLKNQVEELTKKVATQEKKDVQTTKNQEVTSTVNRFISNEINSIKYAGKPNEDGSFTELTDKFIAGKSYYCLDISEGKAIFWVHDDAYAFSQLTLYPDTLLRPACEELNTQLSKHCHIITEKFGEGHAQWDEKKQAWKITKRAKVKYS